MVRVRSDGFSRLYIPIWLYSNFLNPQTLWRRLALYIPIWLYSNGQGRKNRLSGVALHSNLVIFKYSLADNADYLLDFFTFQSGYIQIKSEAVPAARLIAFTFQSGYIQIKLNNIKIRRV
mgnify:CR=1 FL=1